MRRTLTLAIALGTTLAVIAAGSAGSVTVGAGNGVTTVGGELPACSDLADNDGDGLVDLGDPGCSGPLDTDEYNAPTGGGGSTGGGSTGGGSGGGQTSTTPAAPTPTVTPTKPSVKPKPSKTGGIVGPKGKGGRLKQPKPANRNPDGTPTDTNPTLSVTTFGPAPIGVPNFIIDRFEIPPFLLPIYQACGTQYGIPWQVLASINRIETAFGTNLNVSSAGAVGWMQFLPSTWQSYGVDANQDGRKDPYNPVDAICAAARYLKAAGGSEDLRQGIFAYNHADWYVDEVLLYAKQYGKLPDDLVGSLTGLTEGGHFPVAAKARYADDISEREALRRSKTNRAAAGNAADVIASSPTRRGINVYSKVNAPVVAVNDGVIKKMGENAKLGKFIVLEDAYGNRYTYAELGEIADRHPVPKDHALTAKDFELVSPKGDTKPAQPASAGTNNSAASDSVKSGAAQASSESEQPAAPSKPAPRSAAGASPKQPVDTEQLRAKIFGDGSAQAKPAAAAAGSTQQGGSDIGGQIDQLLGKKVPAYETFKSTLGGAFEFDRKTMELRPLKVGSKVTGGTVLGQIGAGGGRLAPHLHFAIRPAGRGAPKIDPKPILDGWKLLESTAIYRAAGEDPFGGSNATIGQVLLMSKEALEQRVLADPRLEIYACGRQDIEAGNIDRKVLAVLEYLVERGYRLTITSLSCGHTFLTAGGNPSAHPPGFAVDIAQVNGIPILGNQGPGTVTESVIKDLLKLQGSMRPAQIISLMDLGPPTFILPDHDDHVHVGYTPTFGSGKIGEQLARVLKPEQWERLIGRLGEIENPEVPVKPSKFSVPVAPKGRSSDAHVGE